MGQRPIQIAVIDDEEAVRMALRRLLRSAGLAVETFSGGGEFLASLSQRRPDCALLDLNMPDVTGYDVLQRLAATGELIPVIVITGNDSEGAEERSLRAGALGFLRKPINADVLLDTITATVLNAGPKTPPQS
jgi:FixJ family two-component response regulator